MADRAYILPRRNDLDGVNIQVMDLHPHEGQRNYAYDPPAQAGYLKYSMDQPGVTVVSGDSYVSGSLTTFPLTANANDDTTGGGNDVAATSVAQFGLIAYLMDRVQPGNNAANAPLSIAQAADMATGIRARIDAANSLTLVGINAALAAVVANTTLDATAAKSFGVVEDVVRILSGETYRLRAFTIIGLTGGGAFQDEEERDVLVAAQDVSANGGTTFYAKGGFLASGPGYRNVRILPVSAGVRSSRHEGQMSHLAAATFAFINPLFDYTGASPHLPRARDIAGNAIPASGAGAVLSVYDSAGNILI